MALKSGRVGIHPSQVDPITGMLLTDPSGASSMADLSDADISDPELGQTLVYNGEKWENQFASISPVTPATLQSLQDVLISSPASGQTLEYDEDENKWVNVFASISPMTLSQLQDVVITDPQDDDYLIYDSTEGKWINSGSAPGPVVPEGSTVTPTDDIQKWLACAGITDKTYTTLNEVLADSTTLLALISSNNASDYLVRSTTWASGLTADSTAMTDIGANDYCAETLLADSTWCNAICNSTYFESVLTIKVPTLSGSSDKVITSGDYSAQPAWHLFDNNTSTTWSANGSYTSGGCYVGYNFTQQKLIKKLKYIGRTDVTTNEVFKVQGYDGSSWVDISDSQFTVSLPNNTATDIILTSNSTKYSQIILYCVSNSNSQVYVTLAELQFYGR